jgi:sugar (pentulose or hexulose) kinase
VLFLPYMLGERTPWWNPDARGAFIGLSLASTRADMMRAVMEGVAMSLGLIADIFRAHVPIDELTVIGGGARSAVWREILADACGCPVRTLTSRAEATSMGAAVIGGVACGLFKNFDAVERFIAPDETVSPNAERAALYRGRRELMERAYRGLVTSTRTGEEKKGMMKEWNRGEMEDFSSSNSPLFRSSLIKRGLNMRAVIVKKPGNSRSPISPNSLRGRIRLW